MNTFERYVAAYIIECLTGHSAGKAAHNILRASSENSDFRLFAEVLEEVRMSPLAVDDLRLKLKVAEIVALHAMRHSFEVGAEVARLEGVNVTETDFRVFRDDDNYGIQFTLSCQS